MTILSIFWKNIAIKYIAENKITLFTQSVLMVFTYLLIRYRVRQNPPEELQLSEELKEQLIREYKPKPLIEEDYGCKNRTINSTAEAKNSRKFLSFDVFNLNSISNHGILEDTIRKYGIGTCGPRGFYGTIDLHLDLEKKLAKIFNKDDAIMYSNGFSTIESVISTYCKPKHTVFYSSYCNEAILRGVLLSKSYRTEFTDLIDLENRIASEKSSFKMVIVEKLCMKTGEYLDLEKIVEYKEKYGLRIIIDESFSIPFLYQNINGLSHNLKRKANERKHLSNKATHPPKNHPKEFLIKDAQDSSKSVGGQSKTPIPSINQGDKISKFIYKDISLEASFYESVDIIVGLLCLGYPSNGGFVCGSKHSVEYQRINSNSYVFSASVPAFLTQASLLFIDTNLPYGKLKKLIDFAFKNINNIVSDPSSPILLIKSDKSKQEDLDKLGIYTKYQDGVIRVCLNIESTTKEIMELAKVINK